MDDSRRNDDIEAYDGEDQNPSVSYDSNQTVDNNISQNIPEDDLAFYEEEASRMQDYQEYDVPPEMMGNQPPQEDVQDNTPQQEANEEVNVNPSQSHYQTDEKGRVIITGDSDFDLNEILNSGESNEKNKERNQKEDYSAEDGAGDNAGFDEFIDDEEKIYPQLTTDEKEALSEYVDSNKDTIKKNGENTYRMNELYDQLERVIPDDDRRKEFVEHLDQNATLENDYMVNQDFLRNTIDNSSVIDADVSELQANPYSEWAPKETNSNEQSDSNKGGDGDNNKEGKGKEGKGKEGNKKGQEYDPSQNRKEQSEILGELTYQFVARALEKPWLYVYGKSKKAASGPMSKAKQLKRALFNKPNKSANQVVEQPLADEYLEKIKKEKLERIEAIDKRRRDIQKEANRLHHQDKVPTDRRVKFEKSVRNFSDDLKRHGNDILDPKNYKNDDSFKDMLKKQLKLEKSVESLTKSKKIDPKTFTDLQKKAGEFFSQVSGMAESISKNIANLFRKG